MSTRVTIFAVCVLAVGLMGEKCDPFGKGGAGAGETSVTVISDPDSRCVALSSDSTSLAFSDGGSDTVWVIDSIDGVLLPFDVRESPPVLLSADRVTSNSGTPAKLIPLPDGSILHTLTTGTGTSSDEEVLRFDPLMLALETFSLGTVPPGITFPDFGKDDTAISSAVCIDTAADDSQGNPITSHTGVGCDPMTAGFRTNLTAGAAINGLTERLFVTSRNLGEFGDGMPQYFPGTVLVYDITSSMNPIPVSPNAVTPVIQLQSVNPAIPLFNATGAVPFTTASGNYILVQTGAIASVVDNDMTSDVEGGFTFHTPASIEVIDANAPNLGVIASISLGNVALAPGLVVDPEERIAVAGSFEGRDVYAIDLVALDAELMVGSTRPNVVITPPGGFGFPGRTTGADPANCPGQVLGLAFNETGDKLFATDFCDGVIAEIAVASTGVPTLSNTTKYVFADRIDSDDATAPKGMTEIAVRPGETTDAGKDVYVLVTSPEGMVCGLDIDTGPAS